VAPLWPSGVECDTALRLDFERLGFECTNVVMGPRCGPVGSCGEELPCNTHCVRGGGPHSLCDRCVTTYHTCVALPGLQMTAAVGVWSTPLQQLSYLHSNSSYTCCCAWSESRPRPVLLSPEPSLEGRGCKPRRQSGSKVPGSSLLPRPLCF